jgi:hypothetical protein
METSPVGLLVELHVDLLELLVDVRQEILDLEPDRAVAVLVRDSRYLPLPKTDAGSIMFSNL